MGRPGPALGRGGQGADADDACRQIGIERIFANPTEDRFLYLRALALELVLIGRYESAEAIYRGLLDWEFQPAGTWVHLARLLLLQDRTGEARQAVANACKRARRRSGSQETPPYVWPRILFLRLLCAMLRRRPRTRLVDSLRRVLKAIPAQMVWTIAPVIDHVRPALTAADLDLLTALAEAIDDSGKLEALDALPFAPAAEGNPPAESGGTPNEREG